MDQLTVYHGTSTGRRSSIMESGLTDPFVGNRQELAEYYAEEASEDDNTDLLVLVFDADAGEIRYDGAAMDEPVMASEAARDKAWADAAADHPEWVDRGYIVVPERAWQVSWAGVGSARIEGTIDASRLRIVLG